MPNTEMPLSDEQHDACARALFNYVWTFLVKPQLSADETDLMIHACHAMWLHWFRVGTPVNIARAQWQLSRVYAVAGLAERSLHYGHQCLASCKANQLGSFDLACAYEALARGHAVAGDADSRRDFLAQAREAAAAITDEQEKKIVRSDLETV